MGNREIKFRFWELQTVFENGKFVKNLGYMMDYRPTIRCESQWNCDLNNALKEEADNAQPTFIMQFTGLKDKNGKEIYEGDIIRNTYRSIYDSYNYTEQVKYNNGYHFKNDGAHTINQQIEVIGNIYETPELLTNGR